MNLSKSFVLEIIDPCLKTVIDLKVIKPFFGFQGYEYISPRTYYFTDTASTRVLGLNPGVIDFCGTKSFSFKLNDTESEIIWGENYGNITFYPQIDSVPGLAVCEMTIKMDEIEGITAFTLFDVTTIGYIPPYILDKRYLVQRSLSANKH